jgi:hypothetical protein
MAQDDGRKRAITRRLEEDAAEVVVCAVDAAAKGPRRSTRGRRIPGDDETLWLVRRWRLASRARSAASGEGEHQREYDSHTEKTPQREIESRLAVDG